MVEHSIDSSWKISSIRPSGKKENKEGNKLWTGTVFLEAKVMRSIIIFSGVDLKLLRSPFTESI